MNNQKTIIELQGLSKRYGFGDSEYYALRDFDLTVKRGEFIMIMGPSGCGKTTLLNIIGLLDKATSGKYLLDSINVSRISNRKQAKFRARQIGFIFQNFNLIPSLPVIENVSLPLVYSGYHKTRRLRMASEVLDHFHLQEREYYMPWQLSGGQQQRVAIARSLVASPSIILADEPTGNLDSRSSHIVMEELRDIHALGNTIIMVTHNPALTTYATRVINMLDGQIDTDIKTVADHDLPRPGDPEKIAVRILPRKTLKTPTPTSATNRSNSVDLSNIQQPRSSTTIINVPPTPKSTQSINITIPAPEPEVDKPKTPKTISVKVIKDTPKAPAKSSKKSPTKKTGKSKTASTKKSSPARKKSTTKGKK